MVSPNQLHDVANEFDELNDPAFQDRLKHIDERLAMLKSLDQSLVHKTPEDENADPKELPVIDSKGRLRLSNTEIRKNYESSLPILNYFQLPYCRACIFNKWQSVLIISVLGCFTYEVKKLLEFNDSKKKFRFRDMNFKRFRKYFLIGTTIGFAFSLIESVLLDDFCDVNSFHYREDRMTAKEKLKILKARARS